MLTVLHKIEGLLLRPPDWPWFATGAAFEDQSASRSAKSSVEPRIDAYDCRRMVHVTLSVLEFELTI